MNADEHERSTKAARLHQRERMRHWSASFLASTALCAPHQNADMALAEFDKRFPPPSTTAESASPPAPAPDYVLVATIERLEAELATLRKKAQMCADLDALNTGYREEIEKLQGKARLYDELALKLAPLEKKGRLWDAVATWFGGSLPASGNEVKGGKP